MANSFLSKSSYLIFFFLTQLVSAPFMVSTPSSPLPRHLPKKKKRRITIFRS